MAPKLEPRTRGRRESDNELPPPPDPWPERIRAIGAVVLAVGAMILSYDSGQKSVAPSIQNREAAQQLEELARVRAENERLKAQK